ncbi:hypothetical protein AzCIB_1385 [Azoarcus sp. CIB]|uniref:hypothetical protein n=1 Tax=Aromatoleum sp. (strain CIB) TaxID=198107 RepID=UPI00067D7E3A|nr:hypothetical protein [Azoarcus sp. CIB]AKU11290.1 hypothetical protein AzCIB_1385 [Azoarcus sp. CIB]
MSKTCLKCTYTRQPSDTSPDYECPKCGAIYAKVEAVIAAKIASAELAKKAEVARKLREGEERVAALRASKRPLAVLKRGAIAAIVGVAAIVAFKTEDSAPPPSTPQATAEEAASKSRDEPSTSQRASLSPGDPEARCYDSGMRIAATYLANFKGAAEAGLTASEMMEMGCKRESTPSCRNQCEVGFKAEVRRRMRN